MNFKEPLLKGIFLKRYKRFFADVDLDGKVVTAHVPNTGSLKSCSESGSPCLLSPSANPERSLKFTLEAIGVQKHWVGVNTSWPNLLAAELFQNKAVPHWNSFNCFQREVKISAQSRIDLVLWSSSQTPITKWKLSDFEVLQPAHLVEIKNVTLREGSVARFPDAVTVRGQKHIDELVHRIECGYRAEMFFVVQRADVESFEPAHDIDPVYATKLKQASKKGLTITAASFQVSPEGISFHRFLPVLL